MKALWQIILAILWRLRPVQALEVNLGDVIAMGLAMFSDDDEVDHIAKDPAYRRTLAAAFFDGHRKLDFLIYLRACEIAGIRPRITSFKPDYSHTHASTDLMKLWKSFNRLVAKFDDYERYAQKRAERLKRDDSNIPPSLRDSPLRLDATHRSTSPARGAVEDSASLLEVLPRRRRGRWIGASSRRDGGGCALARGSPHITNGLARRSAAQAAGGGASSRGWLNATALARGPPPLPTPDFPTPTPRPLRGRDRPRLTKAPHTGPLALCA